MGDAALEGRHDLVLAAALHGHDEGKAEAGLVGVVQLREACALLVGELVEPGRSLLPGGLRRQPPGAGEPAREIGMGHDERELLHIVAGHHGAGHEGVQAARGVAGVIQPCVKGEFRDPGRMFEHAAKAAHKGGAGKFARAHQESCFLFLRLVDCTHHDCC